MSRIFINYRRADAEMAVGRLDQSLREHFSREQVFRDIKNIQPGADFVEELNNNLKDCAVVLVVIGSKWLSIPDERGRRRLDDPEDWVRMEITAALDRTPAPRIIPLLLDGVVMPDADNLPEPLKRLTRRQHLKLSDEYWDTDVARLVATLKQVPGLSRPPWGGLRRNFRKLAGGMAALAVAGLLWKYIVLLQGPAQVQLVTTAPASAPVKPIPETPAPQPEPAKPTPTPSENKPAIPPAPAPSMKPPAPPIQPSANAKLSALFSSQMVKLPGGCFQMGSPPGEQGRLENERQHEVCVGKFAIGKTEVTQDQWQAVMGDNPSKFKCSDCPVEQVSWDQAMEFVKKLNMLTQEKYRLPTEAEWEYACRGGRSGERYCGGNELDAVAWHGEKSGSRPNPVARKQANGFGLYDMSGNVWEWTCSGYDEHYSGGERRCADGAGERVLRGGGWYLLPGIARSASRHGHTADFRNGTLGFRVARTITP